MSSTSDNKRENRGAPPRVLSLPGINSSKKYAYNGWNAAPLLNSSLLAERYMLSVYHASALSKRSSPVWNAPPRDVSLAEYNVLIVSKVAFVTVEGSIRRLRMKVSRAASS